MSDVKLIDVTDLVPKPQIGPGQPHTRVYRLQAQQEPNIPDICAFLDETTDEGGARTFRIAVVSIYAQDLWEPTKTFQVVYPDDQYDMNYDEEIEQMLREELGLPDVEEEEEEEEDEQEEQEEDPY
jgi:hypothetical protein